MKKKRKKLTAAAYAQAWEKGTQPCPECGAQNRLETLTPLTFQTCEACKKPFFAVRKINDFFLYEPAGGGGMGSVYKAVSERFPNRLLAVKLLSREKGENPLNVQALLNEARISSRFNRSQFLAGCLDHGFNDGEYYTVMDFIRGERLDHLIERLGHIPEHDLLALVRHLLAAEQHIFHCGYLYRDLKPENIIVNPQGYAILLDFGLCLPREQARENNDEYITGSPYYLPPERLLGNPEDARSEIYSLGMVMYHALTGRTYFDAEEMNALAKRHVGALRITNDAKMQGITPALAEILAAMIEQNPDKRPASFTELAQKLDTLNL